MSGAVLELGPIFSEFLHRGYKLFNAARIAPTEKEHARAYYDFMAPQSNSFIVDMGAGTGQCGVLLQELDPSLEVLNVVNDPALIKLMQNLQLDCLYASFEDTGIPAASADVVMFNESIGHGNLDKALFEAARVLRAGGELFIKDFTPVDASKETISFDSWGYKIHRQDLFISTAYKNGFNLVAVKHPKMYTKYWFDIIAENNIEYVCDYDRHDMPLCVVLYKFVKGGLNGQSFD
jgi:ubiquinone/menaquinone biosynthesis C-methylase UbiE